MNVMRSHFISRVLAVAAIATSSAFGSNGTHLIAVSPSASGMGGTGVGIFQSELEAMYRNPAFIGGSVPIAKGFRPSLEIAATFGKFNVEGTSSGPVPGTTGSGASNDTLKVLPALAASARLTNELAIGLGLFTFGGTVVDFTNTTGLSKIKSELQTMRGNLGASYKIGEWLTVGAALVVGLNRLALNADPLGVGQSTRELQSRTAVGGQFGIVATPCENFTVGATYLTKTKFNFVDIFPLGVLGGNILAKPVSLIAEEPAELALGVSYVMSKFTVAADYRYIGWNRAEAFGQLGWKEQHVVSLGVKFQADKQLALRAGVNYGKSPNQDTTSDSGSINFQGTDVFSEQLQRFNILGLPAISETQITAGAGYQFSDALSADLAVKFAPSKTVTKTGPAWSASAKANQWGIAGGLAYKF